MKPTKEQLASVKWWRDNVPDDLDFLYECESTGEIALANRDGMDSDGLRLRLELDIWKLLAKRPEPEWVPEPMQVCEINFPLRSWTKVQFIGMDKDEYFVCEYMNGELEKFKGNGIEFRPIKTQREEFVEEAKSRIKNMDADDIILSGKLYDAGCRFDLTEKDGE